MCQKSRSGRVNFHNLALYRSLVHKQIIEKGRNYTTNLTWKNSKKKGEKLWGLA